MVDILLFDGKDGNTYTSQVNASVNKKDPNLLNDDVIFNNYFDYKKKYVRIAYELNDKFEGIYFINDLGANLVKQYLGFIAIGSKKESNGYIILNLKQKRAVSTNVYPELLVDKQFLRTSELKNTVMQFSRRRSLSIVPEPITMNGILIFLYSPITR